MSWNGPVNNIGECRYEIPKSFSSSEMKQLGLNMQVPGLIFTDSNMLDAIKRDDSLFQVVNVATLPGIVGHSIAMPDIHHGYGFAIGAVAAFDASNGVISPGGVGYDINCGVRLMRSNLTIKDIHSRLEKLVDTMFNNIPSGVGSTSRITLSRDEMDMLLAGGARWVVTKGYGWESDLETIEEHGCLEGADPDLVSKEAKKRGSNQVVTLGAGNHFL